MTPHAAASADPKVAVTAPGVRLVTLDILRGLALMGMIFAHFHKLLGDAAAELATNPIGWAIIMFVAEKDRAIFAFLFGVGFALMLRQLESRATPVTAIYLRRLLALYVIGFAVEACTQFHILREYAWWGVALLFLRGFPTRSLFIFALVSAAAFSVRDIVDDSYLVLTTDRASVVAHEEQRQQRWESEQQEQTLRLARATYPEAVALRIRRMTGDFFSLKTFTPSSYLALFIVGLLAVRHGIPDAPLKHRRTLAVAAGIGLLIWAADWWLLPLVPEKWITPRIDLRMRTGLGIVDEQFLAFSYLAAVLLLLARFPPWQRLLAPLGWVGRMALTNYMLHAFVIDFVASSYGAGLRLAPWEQLAGATLLFGTLALVSRFWLTRFRFGPVEWLWRSLAYWRWQPLRLSNSSRQS